MMIDAIRTVYCGTPRIVPYRSVPYPTLTQPYLAQTTKLFYAFRVSIPIPYSVQSWRNKQGGRANFVRLSLQSD